MFGKLREVMGRSLAPTLELAAVKSHLGLQYSVDLENLMEGKYEKDELLKKRAAGVKFLGRAIISTKREFQDDDRHAYFWSDVAKPSIDVRYGMSYIGSYDPSRFYVDAADYAAVMTMLPTILGGGEVPSSHRMIDVIQSLNSREANLGGYFGNTPYWTLHDNQMWRAVDREFTSVQAYWFTLMCADETASGVAADIVKSVLSENIESISSLADEEKTQFFGEDILRFTQLLALGALGLASSKDFNNRRSRGIQEIVNSLAPGAMHAFQTALSGNATKSVRALKSIFPNSHPFQQLPDQSFGLNLSVGAALMKFLPLIETVEFIINMSRTENLINNPREITPHLLHASM